MGIRPIENRQSAIANEFLAVVNARVCYEHALPVRGDKRLPLKTVFGREAHQPLSQPGRSLSPDAAALIAERSQGRVHAVQVVGIDRLTVRI